MKITCNTSSAYHVQRVACHVVRRDSSAVKFDRVEIAFILALLHWLEPLTFPSMPEHRLVGLVVKASASRAEGPGFESRLRPDFFGVESYQ